MGVSARYTTVIRTRYDWEVCIIIRPPSGAQWTAMFSPWSRIDVGVRERYAKTAEGLTRQIETPVLLKVQKRDFRGLGTREKSFSDSGGMLGRAGIEDNWWAVVVGKYIEQT